jgi:thiamine biosynthesis lipoprotein
MTVLSRRRFLTVSAAAVALPASAGVPDAQWRGNALGADASMRLVGVSPAEANQIFAQVEAELARLEMIFSLYRPKSSVSRLNEQGSLKAPEPELLQVLSLCNSLHQASGGAFDPTVQPLWWALANAHGPRDVAEAKAKIGWEQVSVDTAEVRFEKPGMAITLNGIAQGAVTDRIAALLRSHGLRDVLVDIGEIMALGHRGDGAAWRAGVADPNGRIRHRVSLSDRALATSATHGTLLQQGGHILSPTSVQVDERLVSVSAVSAAVADGLSTALCLVPAENAADVLARFPGARLEFTT